MHEAAEPVAKGPWEEFPDAYWQAYFGKQADYYMTQLHALRQGRLCQFSYPAFLLGFAWMIYRRMYIVALAVLLVTLVEGSLETLVMELLHASATVQQSVQLLGNVLFGLLMGSFGNRLYIWDARRSIRQVVQTQHHHAEEALLDRIAAKGGTSAIAVVTLFLALTVLGLLLFHFGSLL